MSLDFNGLPGRFFSLFPRYKQREIAECLYPGEDSKKRQPQISRWSKGLDPIPMEALDRVVDLGLADWNWLLTGQGEPPTPKELREESNPSRKSLNVLIDKGVTEDITYSEKGEMGDSAGVEFLKDHLETLKHDKAKLEAKVALLEKEVAEFREKMDTLRDENKRLLTLSSVRDMTQAGSG